MAKPQRQNRQYQLDEEEFTTCNWLEYALVATITCLLLITAPVLVVFWSVYYRASYAWHEYRPIPGPTFSVQSETSSLANEHESDADAHYESQFNIHPTMMIFGLVCLSGFSMVLYRVSRCCRHSYAKLFHVLLHLLSSAAVSFGVFAVYDVKVLTERKHFFSLHSWIGLITLALFSLQFVLGFFSFVVLLCCKKGTAGCRLAFQPIHANLGITVFMLAIATAISGLSEKAWIIFGEADYSMLKDEALVLNALAVVLVCLVLFVSYLVSREPLRANKENVVSERL